MKLLDTVTLLEDRPTKNLIRGQVGTIVEVLAEGVFEVEFSDENGRTQALLALPATALAPHTAYAGAKLAYPTQTSRGKHRGRVARGSQKARVYKPLSNAPKIKAKKKPLL